MCVGVNVPAAVDVSSSAPSRAQQRQQHEDRSLGHRLRHTTGPTRPHPFRTHATRSYDVGKSPTSFTERPGRRNGSERVWGARRCSLVLVLTRITCLAASCSVRGRMRGDQAQGRGAILGSQQQPAVSRAQDGPPTSKLPYSPNLRDASETRVQRAGKKKLPAPTKGVRPRIPELSSDPRQNTGRRGRFRHR